MYCSNCGNELKKTYKFCPKCGKKVEVENSDNLYDSIKNFVIENNKVSVSLIEKEFKISKNKANEIIMKLESAGVVSPLKGRKREVLIHNVDSSNKKNFDDKIKSKVKEVMDTKDNTDEFDEKDINDNFFLALLSYIGIFAFIPYFIHTDSKFVKYHAKEGINLLILDGIYVLLDGILGFIKVREIVVDYGDLVATRMVTPLFISLPIAIIGLVLTILSIIGIVNVCKGKAKELPLINKIKIIK